MLDYGDVTIMGVGEDKETIETSPHRSPFRSTHYRALPNH